MHAMTRLQQTFLLQLQMSHIKAGLVITPLVHMQASPCTVYVTLGKLSHMHGYALTVLPKQPEGMAPQQQQQPRGMSDHS